MITWSQGLDAVRVWRGWPVRRHVVAVLAAAGTVVVVAVPTAMITTPVFGREVAVTAWAWPVLIVTAVLSGVLFASYVARPGADPVARPGADPAPAEGDGAAADRPGRAGMVGGFLTYLAVGCPVCNKVALIALGYSGAIAWFAPVQPYLGAAGILLLGYALVRRLPSENACPVPVRKVQRVG